MRAAKPPLAAGEVRRVLGLLAPLTDDARVILVGGQALAFWSARLADPDDDVTLVASKDIDFEGSAADARRAANLLDAELMVPSPLEPTPVTGVVTFLDGKGYDRSLDFIDAPRGLDAEDVRETAVRVEVSTDSSGPASFWVMHPERCLESRVYNTVELGRVDPLGLSQLAVAVPIARSWSLSLLGDDSIEERRRQRAVLDLNERIFAKCCEDPSFRAAYERHGVDAFDAVLDDPRLPGNFRDRRYPQMRERLERVRG